MALIRASKSSTSSLTVTGKSFTNSGFTLTNCEVGKVYVVCSPHSTADPGISSGGTVIKSYRNTTTNQGIMIFKATATSVVLTITDPDDMTLAGLEFSGDVDAIIGA